MLSSRGINLVGSRRPPGDGQDKYSFAHYRSDYPHGMALEPRKRMDHESPEWVRAEADYFVTACSESRGRNQFCHPEIGKAILDSVRHRNENGIWFCHLAVLMPDHVHLLLSFQDVSRFSLTVGDWKRWLAKQYGILWQENFFEHRLRKEEGLKDKAEYMLQNPVRAGLVTDPKEWPYVWMPKAY